MSYSSLVAIQPMEATNLLSTLELLCAPKKLDREKGEDQLNNISLTSDEVKLVSSWIEEKLEGLSNWEDVSSCCY